MIYITILILTILSIVTLVTAFLATKHKDALYDKIIYWVIGLSCLSGLIYQLIKLIWG